MSRVYSCRRRDLHKSVSLGFLPDINCRNFNQDFQIANAVISQAGPRHLYQKSGYVITGVSNNDNCECDCECTSSEYRINQDPNPIHIVRPSDPIMQRQNVRIRYLDPPDLPPPAPIIIKERQLSPPPPPPPIVIRQHAPSPPTPPPLIIRERPPIPPEQPPPTVIEKVLPPPSPPPRQVIVERIPAPEKPRDIIYEKWLPYKPQPERPVIIEKGRTFEKQPAPRNIIIDYERPEINIEKTTVDEGIIKADPKLYTGCQSEGELKIVDQLNEVPEINVHQQAKSPINTVTAMTQIQIKPTRQQLITGPSIHNGSWNTTYRSSYAGQGFANHRLYKL